MRFPVKTTFAFAWLCVAVLSSSAHGQSTSRKDRELGQFMDRPNAWFATDEARTVADNVVSYQSELGGWPKNTITVEKPYAGDPKALESTFDNGATTGELRFLARMVQATGDQRYKAAFLKGFDYILAAQYPNGGWPQYYPPHKGIPYQRYITFNDDSMVRLMRLACDVAEDDRYRFVDIDRRRKAKDAFDRGIDCILKCQVKVNGKLTAWCAQHDEIDFSARPARTYELASLSGAETVGIVRILMSVDNPSDETVRAVEAAVAWLDEAKLTGMRVEYVPDARLPRGRRDKVVVDDPNAPPLWARFYEIGTNRPLFVDRDGVPKHHLSEIGLERRTNYNWLDRWAESLLQTEYPAWKTQRAKMH